MSKLFRRIVYLFRRDELEEEMRLHRELRAAKLRESGDAAPELGARKQFGNELRLREESRDLWGWTFLENFIHDIRYSVRQLRKNKAFATVAVATLTLGIGANTAMFTVLNGVLLRPLPYPDPDRLITLAESRQEHPIATFSYPNFEDLQRESQSFESMAAWQVMDQSSIVTGPGNAEVVQTRHVSAGVLAILGIRLLQGRDFLKDQDRRGAAPEAILSYRYWQRKFARDADIIGRAVTVNGKEHTIVGVLPSDFHFFRESDIVVPLAQDDSPDTLSKRDVHPGLLAIGRLKRGVSLQQARAEIGSIAQGIARQYPESNAGVSFFAEPEKEREVGDTRPILLALAGAVGLVLLIACTNVANILLARSVTRRHEFAIRTVLGAGHARVIRQLLTESTLLSLMGGVVGIFLAFGLADFARRHLPPDFVPSEQIIPDARVLLFALAASLITGILFGLAPILQQRSERAEMLKQAVRGTARGLRRAQGALVVAEVALTLILLVGAGLMLRTMFRLWSANPGFDAHNVYRVRVALPPTVANDAKATRDAWKRVLRDVQIVPGVESASLAFQIPLSGDESDLPYWTTLEAPQANKIVTAFDYEPSADYLRTMHIPLLRGRFFTDQDRAGGEPVVVIDEVMAGRAFRNEDALGKKINFLLVGPARVVGIVGHVKQEGLDEDTNGGPMEEAYFPFEQIIECPLAGSVLVRSSLSPSTLFPTLRQAVLGTIREGAIQDIQSLDEMIGGSAALVQRRVLLALLGGFAGIGLLLASIGIYGVISYSVSQRVQEMGIRMALGAQANDIRRLILRQGLSSVLVGIAGGVAGSLGLTRAIKSVLYGVEPSDPATVLSVVLLLTLVACAAAWIPARRASRVDPAVALRYE